MFKVVSNPVLLCVDFACFSSVCIISLGYSVLLSQFRDMQVGLIGNPLLPAKANVGMNGCMSLCVSPVKKRQPIQGVPHF